MTACCSTVVTGRRWTGNEGYEYMGHTKFTTSGAHDVIAITSPQKNNLCTEDRYGMIWDSSITRWCLKADARKHCTSQHSIFSIRASQRSCDTGFATAAIKKSIDHNIRPLHTQTGAWTGDTYGWVDLYFLAFNLQQPWFYLQYLDFPI